MFASVRERVKNNVVVRSFLKDSVTYTLLQLINKAVPFFLLPFVLHNVSKEDYGIYALFLATELSLQPFLSLNTEGALNRHFFDKDIDYTKYFSSVLLMILFNVVTIFFFGYIFSSGISLLTGLTAKYVILVVLSSGMNILISIGLVLFRNIKKVFLYAIYLLANSISLFGLMIVLTYYYHNDYGLILSRFVVAFVFSIAALAIVFKLGYFRLVLQVKYWWKALAYSLPTMLHTISAFVFSASDKFLINKYIGASEVGVYSAFLQLASVVGVLGTAFNTAWVPWLFEHLNKREAGVDRLIVKMSYLLKLAFLVVTLVAIVILYVAVDFFFPASYVQYKYLIVMFVLGYCFQGWYFVVAPYIYFSEKTIFVSVISIFVAIFNLVFNLVFIPVWGIKGAAYSMCLSWLLLYMFNFLMANKVHKMPWVLNDR